MKRFVAAFAVFLGAAAGQQPDEFSKSIKPILVENCSACHNSRAARGPVNFLRAVSAADVDKDRGLWGHLAAHLRNRTMPPTASKLTEQDRLLVSTWVEKRLRDTACAVGDFAGPAVVRRLNRREYRNTIRELLGVDFEVAGTFPADSASGSGFDTNGETLFVPPVLLERYLDAAQQILDRAIVTPPISRTFTADKRDLAAGESITVTLPVYLDAEYDVQAVLDGGPAPKLALKVDGVDAGLLGNVPGRGNPRGRPIGPQARTRMSRGTHMLTLTAAEPATGLASVAVRQRIEPPPPEKRALHYRIFGMEPGERPVDGRKAAQRILEGLLPKAFRRPIRSGETERFLALYDRAAERGDPYEERIKLALKAVLVFPEFLFRVEEKSDKPGIYQLKQHELAARLSYFLWSSMPDETLLRLAEDGKLQDPKGLAAQVERMLDDPRSRNFTASFVGQWLGTQDIGGRVVPLLTEIQSYYNPEAAADLRAQPILLLDRIIGENRSVLEILDADYTHMTQRLVKFYGLAGRIKVSSENDFELVKWPDATRAGVLGMAGVLAMTSRYEQTSPVLRGAWVLETLMGTPVPPPPPDVPVLEDPGKGAKVTMREKLAQHRENAACATCHNLMDPIGLGLENFDWMGRWRDNEAGAPVDAKGELPGGVRFDGPVELRKALLTRKDDFLRHFASKALGYALGRSLQDGDSCTVQRLVETVAKDGYKARTLIREIVLSVPFRNAQGGVSTAVPPIQEKRLNISELNSFKQDAISHNNAVKDASKIVNRKK